MSSSSDNPYANKIVLITGASAGMGKATALYLASKGVTAITLFARRVEKLQAFKDELQAAYPNVKTLVVVGDASKPEDNKRAVEETVNAFGGITSAFVNAGVFKGGTPIHDTDDATIEECLNVNAKGVIYAFRYLVPAIKDTVGESGPTGSIVVNSGCMGEVVVAPKSIGAGIYSASKAFVNSLIKTAAIENAPRIRVTGVMPGLVQTELLPVDAGAYDVMAAEMQSLWGRAGKPQEVASLVGYLISDEASFVSGTSIRVDGLWGLTGGEFPDMGGK